MDTEIKKVILVSLDALRYDCLGYQQDKRELLKYDVLKHLKTPTLDAIAEESICFTQSISTAPYTTTSHASIFTGLYPPMHGVRGFYNTKLSDDIYTLAEMLKVFGYMTVFFTETPVLFLPLELTRGFDHIFVCDEPGLMRFLKEHKAGKVFLFAHFFDVHEPYLFTKNDMYDNSDYDAVVQGLLERFCVGCAPSQYDAWSKWNMFVQHAGRNIENLFPLYIMGVSKFDKIRFGRFVNSLKDLGFYDEALLLIFSDHGEGRMFDADDCRRLFTDGIDRSNWFGHGGALFESLIRVPLIMHHKNFSHRVSDKLVSLVDIFPSVIQLVTGQRADTLLPYRIDGLPLFDEVGHNDVYCEKWNASMGIDQPWELFSFLLWQRALRTSEKKFILYGEPESQSRMDISGLTDAEFLKLLYRKIMTAFESYDEFMKDLRMLKAGEVSRSELLARFAAERYKLYDLQKDPFEENPCTADGDQEAICYYKKKLFDLHASSVRSGTIFPPPDPEKVRGIAERILIHQMTEEIDVVCAGKNLFNELVKKFFESNKALPEKEFFKKCYSVFTGAVPAENVVSGMVELVHSGRSRKAVFDSYFMKKVFGADECAGEEKSNKGEDPGSRSGRISESMPTQAANFSGREGTIEEKEEVIRSPRQELQEANRALDSIRNSKTWRIGQFFGRLVGREAKWRKGGKSPGTSNVFTI